MLWQQRQGEHRFPFSFLFQTQRYFPSTPASAILERCLAELQFDSISADFRVFPKKPVCWNLRPPLYGKSVFPAGNHIKLVTLTRTCSNMKQSNMRPCSDIWVQTHQNEQKRCLIPFSTDTAPVLVPILSLCVCVCYTHYPVMWIGFDMVLDFFFLSQFFKAITSYYQEKNKLKSAQEQAYSMKTRLDCLFCSIRFYS